MFVVEGSASGVSHLTQLVGQQVPQQQSLRGVSHQVTVFAHDFYFLHLVAIVRLEDDPGACGEVPHDDLVRETREE